MTENMDGNGVDGGQEEQRMVLQVPRGTRSDSVSSQASGTSEGSARGTQKKRKTREDEEEGIEKDVSTLEDFESVVQGLRNIFRDRQGQRVTQEVLEKCAARLDQISQFGRRMSLRNAKLVGELEVVRAGIQSCGPSSVSFRDVVVGRVDPTVGGKRESIGGREPGVPARRFSALVTAKDVHMNRSPDDIRKEVLAALDPVKDRIRIDNMRKTRQGVVIDAATEVDLRKIQDNRRIAELGLEIRPEKRLWPKIIVYDVPRDMEKEGVFEAMCAQNPRLMDRIKTDDMEKQVRTCFRTGPRDGDVCHWVMEVSPALRSLLLDLGRLYIGMRRCRACDYNVITRCFRCQGLGHVAKMCSAGKAACGRCAGEGHSMRECKAGKGEVGCALCRRAGKPFHHRADRDCQLYRAAVGNMCKKTDYV